MVRQNVPAAVLARKPVYANVARSSPQYKPNDPVPSASEPMPNQWAGVNYGAPAPEHQHYLLSGLSERMFGSGKALAYAAPGRVARPHVSPSQGFLAMRAGVQNPAAVLRHEGYHGMVDLMRRSQSRAELDAKWHHAAVAAMQNSRFPFVQGLGSHADEIGARVFGEGGIQGLTRGVRHAFFPGKLYHDIIGSYSPAAAKAVRVGGVAAKGAGAAALAGVGYGGANAVQNARRAPPPGAGYGGVNAVQNARQAPPPGV